MEGHGVELSRPGPGRLPRRLPADRLRRSARSAQIRPSLRSRATKRKSASPLQTPVRTLASTPCAAKPPAPSCALMSRDHPPRRSGHPSGWRSASAILWRSRIRHLAGETCWDHALTGSSLFLAADDRGQLLRPDDRLRARHGAASPCRSKSAARSLPAPTHLAIVAARRQSGCKARSCSAPARPIPAGSARPCRAKTLVELMDALVPAR